jgi:hypothetical protein
MRPRQAIASAMADSIDARSVTSRRATCTQPGHRSCRSSSVEGSRAVATTCPPCSRMPSQRARPNPLEQPVITRPDRLPCSLRPFSFSSHLLRLNATIPNGHLNGKIFCCGRRSERSGDTHNDPLNIVFTRVVRVCTVKVFRSSMPLASTISDKRIWFKGR